MPSAGSGSTRRAESGALPSSDLLDTDCSFDTLTRALSEWKEKQSQTEFALRQSESFYHSLVETLPQNIFRKDLSGRFMFANSKFCRTVKRTLAEIIGKTDMDLFLPELAEKYRADDAEVIRSGKVFESVEKHKTHDKMLYVHVVKTPIFDGDGKVMGIQGMFWDETERYETEQRLSEARDQALQSARMKSEFLANMSHEIRTPMNAIIGMTGLLMDTEMTADQRDFSETIRMSADALLSIINDILDFSKIEAGKLQIEQIDFDLTELVEGAADLLAERAQKKGVELAAWIHDDVPRKLRGDPGRLRQILANLLGNAVKFTEKGEVVLDVTLVEASAEGAKVRFSVRDTGVGIPHDAQYRIFEAFTQADGSVTRKFGGTGLGLAITRQLVELMKGEISFESALGEGSKFWFEIPLEFSKQLQTDRMRKDAILENVHVLIVDDNATNRQILKYQTNSRKMRNECAANAHDALTMMRNAVAAKDPFKVVLLDMQMPGVDGIMLANQIKNNPELASAQLVMLTSLGYLPTEPLWKEVGIRAYLVKPVKQNRLFDTVIEVLKEPEASAAGKTADKNAGASEIEKTKARILLAEDNPVNQKVALRQLSKLGYEVDAVPNGAEAVKSIEKMVYPLILMDVQMPQMDGHQATRRIREMQAASPFKWAHRPYIIAMTANALAGDREACLAAGMDDYISKPVHVEELEAALQRGLKNMESGSAQPNPAGASAKNPLVDTEALDNLRMLRMDGEPDPLAELVQLFINDTPDRLAQMKAAFNAKDGIALDAAAHSLKGSASNLGARGMASDCARIMQLAKKNDLGPTAELLNSVEEGFSKVKAILLDEIRR